MKVGWGGGGGGGGWRRQKIAKGEGAEVLGDKMHVKCMDNKIIYKSSNATVGANKVLKQKDRSMLFMKYPWH